MITNESGEKVIGATETAFDIVEAIADSDSSTVSEITREVDCSRSTVYYHVKTLEKGRYILHDGEGYRLGLRMARFSERAKRQHPLYGATDSVVDELAAEAGLSAFVGVEEGGKLVCLARSERSALEGFPLSVGREYDLHALAHGQAILTCLPDERVEEVVSAHGLSARTETTLAEPGQLVERLNLVEEVGVAYSAEEYAEGVSTLAAPVVRKSTEGVAGAIGVVGPVDRIDDPYKQAKARRFSDEHTEQVRRAAQILSNHLAED